eukprot:TRINITY_DN39473_c0_g1_i2.p1 TRINITY_DN39473_c0_g1~~TRINITY_DN39473_c0_g1_i2.p1  ORF type:complete len:1469 (-),score=289.01 TRINITY_DN39473_c0_g1_i2:144-4550(-)
MESASEGSSELQCVGKLEIVKPKPVLGFICGTLPVPTDNDFHAALIPSSSSSSSSSSQTVRAPRYQMLPTETDLNTPPLLSNSHVKAFPIAAAMPAKSSGDLHWESDLARQNLARKCETLAVSGLAEYGDEIDVVAPADILKQIFKIPYSKARLSVAVHRIGQALVLNTGPDIEEGEKLVRRQSNQSKSVDQSIFLNFAMHSVRAEACDCPPSHNVPSEDPSDPTILPGHSESREGTFVSSAYPKQGANTQLYNQSVAGSPKEGFSTRRAEFSEDDQDSFYWGSKQNKQKNRHATIKKTSQVGEKPRCTMKESEKYKRAGNDGFLRVLFWQFHNFRMLLGSDLLLFSNEKYVAVSLHLWDVTRQVTPLTWLEAWLDNVMASVPELAICYHENGVVQGYELLKTDDIFLLKGISEDGTPAFHPQTVQQNGLSVLRFLQDNCKQDPGAYWLYKSAGEDVIQLFDLSVLPKSHSSDNHDKVCSSLPSLMQKGRRDTLFSLGTLLYRLAHRLSLSKAPNSRSKCVGLFKKCLDFLDEQDHLVVRAHAHEQFARLILTCYEELDLTSESFLLESEVTVTDVEDDSEFSLEMIGSTAQDEMPSQVVDDVLLTNDGGMVQNSEASGRRTLEDNAVPHRDVLSYGGTDFVDLNATTTDTDDKDSLAVSTPSPHMVHTVADPISSKLLAIHHVSQAIKSLRWKRQLENTEGELIDHGKKNHDRPLPAQFSVCACGDADCIEVCDIREWLAKSKMDRKLWKLVLLLGESYLALAEAYKENNQLCQALKVVRLACTLYGSMPKQLEDAQFISSMTCSSSSLSNFKDKSGKRKSVADGTAKSDCSSIEEYENIYQCSSNHLFWAKTWTLVGDVYVELHMTGGTEMSIRPEKPSSSELRVPNEVVKEVRRLKKKLGQFQQNCSTCSLINCSCQSDRASSGNSASSSSGDTRSMTYGRKQTKKLNLRYSQRSFCVNPEDEHVPCNVEHTRGSEGRCPQKSTNDIHSCTSHSQPTTAKHEVTPMVSDSVGAEDILEMRSMEHRAPAQFKTKTRDALKSKIGGIFKFLECPVIGDVEYYLATAISCYDASMKTLCGLPNASSELQSVVKKKGWACNELGRHRLASRDLDGAELAFMDAIKAFKEVADHANIILINCNLGHGRRALAEAMVSKMETLGKHGLFQNAYKQALETAKSEYSESLRIYGAARSELIFVGEFASSAVDTLRSEVHTQLAHTYLKLGMLLAKEDTKATVYESVNMKELSVGPNRPKGLRRHEISANDAIREALYIYESLGELRKQEAAYAYFQLACFHRDCCQKFLDRDFKQIKPSISEKIKDNASLAERNWQKSIDFYGPKTHPIMYLTILMDRSDLFLRLSSLFHSNAMLESALSQLLEGRHVVGKSNDDFSGDAQHTEVDVKFWAQLQTLLKNMLTAARPGCPNKSSVLSQAANRAADAGKLKELYRMSLKPAGLSQLHDMYELWAS